MMRLGRLEQYPHHVIVHDSCGHAHVPRGTAVEADPAIRLHPRKRGDDSVGIDQPRTGRLLGHAVPVQDETAVRVVLFAAGRPAGLPREELVPDPRPVPFRHILIGPVVVVVGLLIEIECKGVRMFGQNARVHAQHIAEPDMARPGPHHVLEDIEPRMRQHVMEHQSHVYAAVRHVPAHGTSFAHLSNKIKCLRIITLALVDLDVDLDVDLRRPASSARALLYVTGSKLFYAVFAQRHPESPQVKTFPLL